MKISECSYCGKMALIENEACYDCAKAMGVADEPAATENNYSAESENYYSQPNYTSQNAAYEYEPRPRYTPVSCWRCKEINVWEQTKICLKCGCALKLYKTEEAVTMQGESILNSPGIRSMLIILLLVVTGVGTAFYFTKTSNLRAAANQPAQLSQNQPKVEEVKLPTDSWYQPSIWNFYREMPTVEEILKKNNEATSKYLKTNNFKTLSLSGKLSVANGGCAVDKCAQEEKKKSQLRANLGDLTEKYRAERDLAAFKVGLVDYFEQFEYRELGTIEAVIKFPDKIYRKVSITPPGQAKFTENTEGYDGLVGWRKTFVRENGQTLENSVKTLMETELFELKNSVGAWGNNFSSKNLSFVEMKKIKGKVQFVLKKDDSTKGETIYFDAVTGFVTQINSHDMNCYLSFYSDQDGYKMPSYMFFRTITPDGNAVFLRAESLVWKIDRSVEDSIFAKP